MRLPLRMMSELTNPRQEGDAIKVFVRYLAEKLYPGLQIAEWPDKTNTSTADIDAVAEAGSQRIAIEHTSADSLPDQRLHDDRFMKAIGYLENELSGQLNYRLRVTIPFGSVPTGIYWNGIRDRLRRWILHDVPSLPYGIKLDIRLDGVPFPLTVHKSSSCVHGLFLARSLIEYTDFTQRLPVANRTKGTKACKV